MSLLLGLGACAAPNSVPPTATAEPATPMAATSRATLPTSTLPPPTVSGRTASIKEIVNTVQARGSLVKDFQPANIGLTLNVGGQARTAENSKARLDFIEGTIVRLGPTTVLTVEELAGSESSPLTRFQLELGKLWIALRGGILDVKTPAGIVSIRGSYSIIEVFADGIVRVAHLEGTAVHAPTTTTLTNMKGMVLNRDGTIADRFDVPYTFLLDFCDHNDESCRTLLSLLGIKGIDTVREIIEKNPPEKESPKSPPCSRRGC
jgi:hypothetical protein